MQKSFILDPLALTVSRSRESQTPDAPDKPKVQKPKNKKSQLGPPNLLLTSLKPLISLSEHTHGNTSIKNQATWICVSNHTLEAPTLPIMTRTHTLLSLRRPKSPNSNMTKKRNPSHPAHPRKPGTQAQGRSAYSRTPPPPLSQIKGPTHPPTHFHDQAPTYLYAHSNVLHTMAKPDHSRSNSPNKISHRRWHSRAQVWEVRSDNQPNKHTHTPPAPDATWCAPPKEKKV